MPLRSLLERHFHFLVLRWVFALRIVPAVFLLRLILVCLTGLALSGCALLYSIPHHERYHRVRVTDIEGHVVAEWIAEGFVWKTEQGYKFRAVERRSGYPYPQFIKYPLRKRVEIGGQNIEVWRVDKPYWLYLLEGV